jgi:hypothetical protein
MLGQDYYAMPGFNVGSVYNVMSNFPVPREETVFEQIPTPLWVGGAVLLVILMLAANRETPRG